MGKAACLLLAMPGKASEAVVWPLSDSGGSEETSGLTAGKPRKALLVLEPGGAGRLASGWWVGEWMWAGRGIGTSSLINKSSGSHLWVWRL